MGKVKVDEETNVGKAKRGRPKKIELKESKSVQTKKNKYYKFYLMLRKWYTSVILITDFTNCI